MRFTAVELYWFWKFRDVVWPGGGSAVRVILGQAKLRRFGGKHEQAAQARQFGVICQQIDVAGNRKLAWLRTPV